MNAPARPRTAGVPVAVERLCQVLTKLPGVGEKTARRHALHIAMGDLGDAGLAAQLEHLLGEVRAEVGWCEDH